MVITKISSFGVKLTQGNYSIAINPATNQTELTNGTFSADLVLLSATDNGFASAKDFLKKDNSTFVISSPGEYEKDDLFVYGVGSTTNYGQAGSLNTNFYFNLDGIDVLVLGAHEPDNLPSPLIELVDNIDLLILPIGGDSVMGPIAANKLATKLEAKLLLPVGYDDNTLSVFKDEFSHEIETVEKLVLKSNDIPTTPKAFILAK